MNKTISLSQFVLTAVGLFASVVFSSLGVYTELHREIITTGQQVKTNSKTIKEIKTDVANFEDVGIKILLDLQTIKGNQQTTQETVNEIKAQNAKFERDIDKFYQLNKSIKRP